MAKNVYFFGEGKADGNGKMKELLGGKGAGLAEMVSIGIPVPAGFTITTEVCTHFYQNHENFPPGLEEEIKANLTMTEKAMGSQRFGNSENPLLVSVRSGARKSMPGMMETVLNVGLCSTTIPGLIKKTGNPRFVYDAYRRLIMMYSDVVMEKAAGIEPEEGKGIRVQLQKMYDKVKKQKGYKLDTDLSENDLKKLCQSFKKKVKDLLGKEFPDDPWEQLLGGIKAVFNQASLSGYEEQQIAITSQLRKIGIESTVQVKQYPAAFFDALKILARRAYVGYLDFHRIRKFFS